MKVGIGSKDDLKLVQAVRDTIGEDFRLMVDANHAYNLNDFILINHRSICQELVRFCAYLRIKPHAPPFVWAPVNSFEFQSCDCTPQAECLMR